MMKAICEAVGDDGFILGCNAPMWPSIGVVNAMRVSNDVARRWNCISVLAKEIFYRNWQNGRLWLNDPDCMVQISKKAIVIDAAGQIAKDEALTEDEYTFQAACIFTSGGMLMAGDDLVRYTDREFMLTVPFVVNVINLFHLAFNNKQYHKSLYISIPKCNKKAIEKAAIILCRFCSITLNIFLQMTVFQVRVFLCIRMPQFHLQTSLHR